jgi:hypothetical protein
MTEESRGIEPQNDSTPRSLAIAERGIRTGHDFANLMSAVMSDLIAGRMTPSVGNAACNAGGKLLKVVEMSHKLGSGSGGARTINLANPELAGE